MGPCSFVLHLALKSSFVFVKMDCYLFFTLELTASKFVICCFLGHKFKSEIKLSHPHHASLMSSKWSMGSPSDLRSMSCFVAVLLPLIACAGRDAVPSLSKYNPSWSLYFAVCVILDQL